MKKLLLSVFMLIAAVSAVMAQGAYPKVYAVADGDINGEDMELKEFVALAIGLFLEGDLDSETADGVTYYVNAKTRKRLFWMDNATTIHLCPGVTAADRIGYSFTEAQLKHNEGTDLEGYTGVYLSFCTETLNVKLQHGEQLQLNGENISKNALDFMSAVTLLLVTGELEVEDDGNDNIFRDSEGNPLLYQLYSEEGGTVMLSKQHVGSGITVSAENIDLATRYAFSNDHNWEINNPVIDAMMYSYYGCYLSEILNVKLTLDGSTIPEPDADISLTITDNMEVSRYDPDLFKKMSLMIINAELTSYLNLVKLDRYDLYDTNGKKLFSIAWDEDEDKVIFKLGDNVTSADNIIIEVDDFMREMVLTEFAAAGDDVEFSLPSDPYSWKTVGFRFVTASGINNANADTGTAARYYSIDGRRLMSTPTRKGMYIINNRKVVVK